MGQNYPCSTVQIYIHIIDRSSVGSFSHNNYQNQVMLTWKSACKDLLQDPLRGILDSPFSIFMCHSVSSCYLWYVIELVVGSINEYLYTEHLLLALEQDCHDCTNFSIAYSPHYPCIGYYVGRSQVYTSHIISRLLVLQYTQKVHDVGIQKSTNLGYKTDSTLTQLPVNRHVQHSARTA